MNPFTPICRTFFSGSSVEAVEEIKIGHINRTYKVSLRLDDGSQQDYLLQALNTYVFKQPLQLMENIAQVTEHLRRKAPDGCNLTFYRCADGNNYFINNEGFWRLQNFVPSVTHNSGDNLSIVAEAGKAFGQFQNLLADFPAEQLNETIPHFHDTRSRFAALRAAVEADSADRLSLCREEVDSYLALEDSACRLTDLHHAGQLPLRVTHNDTKINNVLFDEQDKALVVIDLDTVMPGLVGHDFGDAIRFAANTQPEDSSDLDKVHVNVEIFRAFAEAFLQQLASHLTQTELNTLALSALAMTAECGARFLTDYLQGDVYFKTAHAEHNLQRARCQLALAQDIQRRLPELDAIVRQAAEKYR